MAGREGFYLTLLSDGPWNPFPIIQWPSSKRCYPLNLTDGDWEVALTEKMYFVDLKNISTHETYFDVFVPDVHDREVIDPNQYGWNRLTKEKLGTAHLHECSSLIPWEQTPWNHYIAQGGSILLVNMYRICFRAGAYTQHMALIKEINEGLERTLKQVWKKLGNPREISNMKLMYYPDYDRVMY
jgi:hypothetical protein